MINFIKKPSVIIFFVIIALGSIGVYVYFGRSRGPVYDFVVAKRTDLIQEVNVTGRVKPAEDIDLAFEKNGKAVWIGARIGDKVVNGQILIRLNNDDLAAQLIEAGAKVKAQKAKLDELRAGTRPEEIRVQEVKVENAKIALDDARKNLIDKLQDAYTKSDDAVRTKADQFFSSPRSPNPQLNFYLSDHQLVTNLEQQRTLIEKTLISWKPTLGELTISSDLVSYINLTKEYLDQIKSFLDKAAFTLNLLSSGSALSQTTLDAWKADISTARTNIYTATTNLSSAEEKLRTAESSLVLAENELVLKKAGFASEQISAQEAQVEQAEANVKNIQAQIAKTILRSPISGIVTKQEARVGEIISANTSIISIISEADFEIEANIPEADIAKVKINDSARITLDAYGADVVFNAKIIAIDPAETIIEGVATYKTTFRFDQQDERIKSGMTANVDILSGKHEGVIVVPQRAIINKNGNKEVRILRGEITEEIKVKTGLRGSDGNIEILEGVNEGDKVIISF